AAEGQIDAPEAQRVPVRQFALDSRGETLGTDPGAVGGTDLLAYVEAACPFGDPSVAARGRPLVVECSEVDLGGGFGHRIEPADDEVAPGAERKHVTGGVDQSGRGLLAVDDVRGGGCRISRQVEAGRLAE